MAIGPTSMINSGVQALGGLAQSGASIAGNVKTESAKTDATGSSESVSAQREATAAQDKNGAEMIRMQSEATIQKQTQDALNAIASGKQDSVGKEQSALAKNATNINF